MIWYPNIDNLKTKYSNLDDEHNLVCHYIFEDKEPTLLGLLDILQYGLPMKPLDFWMRTLLFLQGVVSHHPCSEGNHRFAYISTKIFLRKNGYLLKLLDEGERFTRLVGDKLVGGNPIRNLKFVARWLKSACFKKGDVVVAKFPFSNLTEFKVRLILLVGIMLESNDSVALKISIKGKGESIPIHKEDIAKGKIRIEPSYVIIDQPIKIQEKNIRFKVAELKEEILEQIKEKVRSLYQ